jgi:nicotinamide-nucleotide amidase
MNAIVLSVGDELVLGQTVDTNSAWISQQLAAVGVPVSAHMTVGDDQAAIEQAISESADRASFVIISGGIGPTADDLTRQALAAVLHTSLELDQKWLVRLQEFFHKLGREMPETNRIQAMIPRGAVGIDNENGTAMGIKAWIHRRGSEWEFKKEGITHAITLHECFIAVMPGVPKEMKAMFANQVLPIIRNMTAGSGVILQRTLHTFGLGESTVAEKLGPLMKRDRNPSVGTTVANGFVSLRVNARFDSREKAQQEIDHTITACYDVLGDTVWGEDDTNLQQVVGQLLASSRKTVTTAESCTGGLLAKMLTDISGSSDYFKQGWVTYSNQAKYERLGVANEIINVYGAVSEPVVAAMAKHARRLAKADFALSISGIAGPGGGSPTKPVGTVCIGFAYANPETPKNVAESEIFTRQFTFTGDREMVRDRSAKMALTILRFHLLGKPLPF